MLQRYLLPAFLVIQLSGFLTACSTVPMTEDGGLPPPTQAETEQASQTVHEVFEHFYQSELERSPVLRSQLGLSGQFDWDDISAEAYEQQVAQWQILRNELSSVREDALTDADRASYQALLHTLEYRLLTVPFAHYSHRLTDQHGWHKEVVRTLVKYHPINSIADAHDYINRLEDIPQLFNRWEENIRNAASEGVVAPDFVYARIRSSIGIILNGAPFTDSSQPSPLWADFTRKLQTLNLYPASTRLLERKARSALLEKVAPAYRSLLTLLDEQHALNDNHLALSQQAEGLRYYQLLLSHYTGGQMDANDIHQIGLAEVSRLQQQLRRQAIKAGAELTPDDPENSIFTWVRSLQQPYSDNAAGQDEFIGYQKKLIVDMAARLPYFFVNIPATPLALKIVPEDQAWLQPIMAYEAPSLDGTRPGVLLINPAEMNSIDHNQQAALLYGLAIPGRHLATALSRENDQLPEFRRIYDAPAFTQGWSLYAGRLAEEMGMYKSPEEQTGQLLSELRDSAALVVDTGIHSRNWSWQQAVSWLSSETPLSVSDSEALIEDCILHPGSSVSAKMGQFRISALRREMEDRLGSRFDLAAFHAALLAGGPLPMETLEDAMRQWADQVKAKEKDQ